MEERERKGKDEKTNGGMTGGGRREGRLLKPSDR